MASVELEILAITKQAQKDIEGFGATATKSLRGVEKSFSALKAVAGAAIGFIAGRAAINAFSNLTEAAAESEDAFNELSTAIRLSGKQINATNFSAFAAAIQATTKYEDDFIIKNAAVLQNLAQLDEQGLKRATKAAVDLSAALRIDLGTATEMIGKAAQGQIGTFSRYGLAVKAGATNAETLSAVLTKIETQFGGAAAAQVNTYSGAVAQAKNVWGDLKETLGNIIIQNPAIIGGIKALTDGLLNLIGKVEANKDKINAFVEVLITGFARSIPALIKLFGFFIKSINALQLALSNTFILVTSLLKAFLEFKLIQKIVNYVTDQITGLVIALSEALRLTIKIGSALPGAKGLFGSLGIDADETVKSLKEFNLTLTQTLGSDVTADVRTSLDELTKSALSFSGTTDGFFAKFEEGISGVAKTAEDTANSIVNSMGKTKGAASGVSFAAGTGGGSGSEGEDPSAAVAAQQAAQGRTYYDAGEALMDGLAAFLKELPTVILDGAEGAKKAIAKGVGAIADYFLPGLGQILGPFFEQLMGMSSGQIKTMITEFVKALPQFMEALVEGLIVVATVLPEVFIDYMLVRGGLVRIVTSLITLIPRVGYALAESFVRAIGNALSAIDWSNLSDRLSVRTPDWLDQLTIETPDWISNLKIETPPWLEQFAKLISDLTNWSPGGAGGTGVNSWGGWLGDRTGVGNLFSRGGLVKYAAAGMMTPRGTDTVPAMLTPGELVVPKESTSNLFSLIDQLSSRMSGEQKITVNLTIGERELADVILDLNQKGYRTA